MEKDWRSRISEVDRAIFPAEIGDDKPVCPGTGPERARRSEIIASNEAPKIR